MPILHYWSVAWDTQTADESYPLERVTRKLMGFVSHTLEVIWPTRDYSPVPYKLNLISPSDHWRQCFHNTSFLRDLHHSSIYSSSLWITFVDLGIPHARLNLCKTTLIPSRFLFHKLLLSTQDTDLESMLGSI